MVRTCEQSCSDCMTSPVCLSAGIRIICDLLNRQFRSKTCFDNHKIKRGRKKKIACDRKYCVTCGALITQKKHECNKQFCVTCNENKEVRHLCFMRPLVNVPGSSELVLYVFYGLETTQDKKRSDKTSVHVPNPVCLQQFCSKCENIPDINQDCIQCAKRKHSFWDNPVGDMLNYLCESRPWVEKITVIAHNEGL